MGAHMKVDRAEVSELLREGWTREAVAERFEIHPQTVTRIRNAMGLPPGRPVMTPERRARIETMLDDGWSFKEIQRTEGADQETLRKHFPGRAWTIQQRTQFVADTKFLDPDRILTKGWRRTKKKVAS